MSTCTWRGRHYRLASQWNDLTTERAEGLYQIIMATNLVPGAMADTDVAMRRILAWRYLAGITDSQWAKVTAELIKEYDIDLAPLVLAEEIEEHLPAVDFLFNQKVDDDGDTYWEVAPTLTKNPHPRINIAGITLYGPANGLDNVSIYEMGKIFTLYEQFVEQGSLDTVHELLATMYRPAKPDTAENQKSAYGGDRRLPLRGYESTIDKRLVAMAALPEATKQILLFWVASCRHAIVESFPKVFDPPSDPDAVSLPNYGWGGVLLSLADGIVHLDAVADQPHGTALAYLSLLEDRRTAQKAAERRAEQRSRSKGSR